MVRTAKRINSTDAYDTSTYSIAIIEVPNLSLVSVDIGNTQPSRTLTIGFFTRDPIGYEGGDHLYEYVLGSPLKMVDPSGLEGYLQPSIDRMDPPVVPPQPSEEEYAKSKCYCACASIVNGVRYLIEGDALGVAIRVRCEAWADTFFPRLSRENSALRHCCAGGQLATRLSCACSQCLEDYRDVAQYYAGGQSWTNTQQAIYNDREGRKCANCTGKEAGSATSGEEAKGSGLFDCLIKQLHRSALCSKSSVSHSDRRLTVAAGEMGTRLVM